MGQLPTDLFADFNQGFPRFAAGFVFLRNVEFYSFYRQIIGNRDLVFSLIFDFSRVSFDFLFFCFLLSLLKTFEVLLEAWQKLYIIIKVFDYSF